MATDIFLPMYFQGLYPIEKFDKIDLWSRDFYMNAVDFYSKKATSKQREKIIAGIKYLSYKIKLIDEFEYIGIAWDQANTLMFAREVFFKGTINLVTEFKREVNEILEERKSAIEAKNEIQINRLKEENKNNKMNLESLNNLIVRAYSKSDGNDIESSTLKTFSGISFTEEQLKEIRKRLIDKKIIDRISESDFLYLFNGKPITKTMIILDWKKSLPLAHSFLKRVVFTDKPFNMKQVNDCIKFKNEKKLDSNNKSSSQYTHNDILNPILQF